jgi:hypothetical protein
VSSLDLCLSTFRGDELRCANRLFDGKSETLSKQLDDNSTRSKTSTSNREYHILKRDFETKSEIHDGCISSLSNTNEQTGSTIESTKNADVTMGIRLSNCPNSRRLAEIETRFGKLFRVGSLGGYNWTDEIKSKPCRFVHPHYRFTQEEFRTSGCQGPVRNLQVCDKANCFSSASKNSPILVDTFEKSVRSQIATYIVCNLSNTDPKELSYYIANVADLGFDHIIFIGETEYGMIFLDCYGRVFNWNDSFQMAYPLGNSLEEVPKRPIEDIGWFEENGIVYEYIGES